MALLIYTKAHDPAAWAAELNKLAPDLDIRRHPDTGNPNEIDVALVAKPPPSLLRSFPNLKLIHAFGAGVDAILADPALPRHVPLARVIDDRLTVAMTEYVLLHVLRFHRQVDAMASNQRNRAWKWLPPVDAAERVVGIMGMGTLGMAAAQKLGQFGFQLVSWSRGLKAVDGVTSFHGEEHLDSFLRLCNVLVCLLPLTPATRGIINRRTLSLLPRGAYVINAARGGHVVEADLLHALDSEWLSGATLDVFDEEPLRDNHPFWTHPKVTVTPHNAADSIPAQVAPQIVDNIRRLQQGLPLLRLVDYGRGY
ncbi:MAG: glyoxylate/hydroxypyruvate reductase A [Ferrovibrio sp.]|uniref:2-hydroxyacid dehydrogenase n=1 Tax=Ferrovibrio sp. TaxID=1917215 RepID=UPI0026361B1F|nr:glyoxylate/hydroxypyruvate reductase A [Ferrovibrio sp.]MCW0236187.1 glyoxylate/hydroxypyruvate reductase A [Ferrovibrio sp.]